MPAEKKLSDEEVLKLRASIITGKESQHQAAKRLGVSQALVCKIMRGKARKQAWEGKQGLFTLKPE